MIEWGCVFLFGDESSENVKQFECNRNGCDAFKSLKSIAIVSDFAVTWLRDLMKSALGAMCLHLLN
jgi:hypothetical protein